MKVDLKNSLSYCVQEKKPCVGWVQKYFKDCLCNTKDDLSFCFGLISLVCWGVAEIPQIITNFRTKSSHGVSLAFLLTWIAGDIFNLIGCLLEPATLPTQYYTAVLYTLSTIILVLQSIYYDYFYSWWKCRQIQHSNGVDQEDGKTLRPSRPAGNNNNNNNNNAGIPIPGGSPQKGYYYTSARSLAGSSTPPIWSYIRTARSGPSAVGLPHDSSSDDDNEPIQSSYKSSTQPKPIPRSAISGAIIATAASLPQRSKAMIVVYAGLTGRRLLHESGTGENVYGQYLGWLMAAIYMGGRIPQIWLNIKRGSVEGLNPLMFIFALIANVTYVASILVRSTEADKLKANLPWLLDAAVCVALDFLIIMQYVYYRYIKKENTEEYGHEANKPLLA